ncbi:MAG: EMC3/TMCO1 family protein [Candidatus Nanoarchaeia archaeon]
MASIFIAGYQAFMNLPYFWIIFIISLLATLLTTVIYKYTTDQKQLKQIKKDLKDLKEKMKKNKNDQKKMMSIQKDMLDKNMIMMKQSFKSMLYTFIPLILIFAWMASTIAYEPITPESNITVTATISNSYIGDLNSIKVSSVPETQITRNTGYAPASEKVREIQWIMQVEEEGTYNVIVESDTFKQSKELLVTTERKYVNPVSTYKESQLKQIKIGAQKVKPMMGVPLLESFGWLGTYILLSILMSIGLRKLMNVA